MDIDAQALAERYAAVWNENDAAARRAQIAQLWRADGVHFVTTREARGLAALELRVADAWAKNVRDAGHAFRAARDAQALRGVVTFHWEMVRRAGSDEVLAVGLEFLQLDDDGRIAVDHQFIVG